MNRQRNLQTVKTEEILHKVNNLIDTEVKDDPKAASSQPIGTLRGENRFDDAVGLVSHEFEDSDQWEPQPHARVNGPSRLQTMKQ